MPKITINLKRVTDRHIIAHSFTELITIDSTNHYARNLVKNNEAVHGQVITAEEQTGGKGQFEKKWLSPKGESLSMTVILESSLIPIPTPFYLSAAVAVSCAKALEKATQAHFSIKWPNDLYIGHKKAGGILIEHVKAGRSYFIIGIGVNVNQTNFPSHLHNPTSLYLMTGIKISPKELAILICDQLDYYLNQLIAGNQKSLYIQYHNLLYQNGQEVLFKKNGKYVTVAIMGVTDQGLLRVFHDGTEKLFSHGEFEWVIPTDSGT